MAVEQRQHKRYVFSKNSDVRASMSFGKGGGKVEVKILNISEGGLGLAAEKNQLEHLEVEDELLMESVQGHPILDLLAGERVRVKWILNYEPLAHLGFGCEFISLKTISKQQIQGFIAELKTVDK